MNLSFNDKEFYQFKQFIHKNFGIYFSDAKNEILRNKLTKLMLRHDIKSFQDYYCLLQDKNSPYYLTDFINEITVHKTNFFREKNHFEFIKTKIKAITEINPSIIENNEIRAWSAACSTGEEAYTLAIVLKECLPETNIKILATDISSQVLLKAKAGIYMIEKGEIERYYINKYFTIKEGLYHVTDDIRDLITFRQFNLMETFPFKKSFDIIFCRNVLIYFDLETQQQLIDKMYQVLAQGGLMFLGHSEALINKRHNFKYLQPTIYMK